MRRKKISCTNGIVGRIYVLSLGSRLDTCRSTDSGVRGVLRKTYERTVSLWSIGRYLQVAGVIEALQAWIGSVADLCGS